MNLRYVKYLALAFALVLALGLISFFVNGGLALLHTFGLIQNEELAYSDSNGNFHQVLDNTDYEDLSVSFKAGILTIQKGDQFAIDGINLASDLIIENSDNKLEITDPSTDDLIAAIISNNQTPMLTITVPEGYLFDEVSLSLGASQSSLADLTTKKLIIDHGAGSLNGSNLKAESGLLNGGAGNISFSGCHFNDFEFDCGVGLLAVDGLLTGSTDFDCGVGSTTLTVHGKPEDYLISVNTGLGPISLDGNSVSDGQIGSNDAPNTINIDGGIGPVIIKFYGAY